MPRKSKDSALPSLFLFELDYRTLLVQAPNLQIAIGLIESWRTEQMADVRSKNPNLVDLENDELIDPVTKAEKMNLEAFLVYRKPKAVAKASPTDKLKARVRAGKVKSVVTHVTKLPTKAGKRRKKSGPKPGFKNDPAYIARHRPTQEPVLPIELLATVPQSEPPSLDVAESHLPEVPTTDAPGL